MFLSLFIFTAQFHLFLLSHFLGNLALSLRGTKEFRAQPIGFVCGSYSQGISTAHSTSRLNNSSVKALGVDAHKVW